MIMKKEKKDYKTNMNVKKINLGELLERVCETAHYDYEVLS